MCLTLGMNERFASIQISELNTLTVLTMTFLSVQGQEMMVPVTTVLIWKFCQCSGSRDGPIKMEVTKVLCQCPSRKSYVVKYICHSGFFWFQSRKHSDPKNGC